MFERSRRMAKDMKQISEALDLLVTYDSDHALSYFGMQRGYTAGWAALESISPNYSAKRAIDFINDSILFYQQREKQYNDTSDKNAVTIQKEALRVLQEVVLPIIENLHYDEAQLEGVEE